MSQHHRQSSPRHKSRCLALSTLILWLSCGVHNLIAKPNEPTKAPKKTQADGQWYHSANSYFNQYNDPNIAPALNWQPDDNNLCGGHYVIPNIIANYPNPPHTNQLPLKITARGPIKWLNNGLAIARDQVIATQPGRRATGDTAYIYYNKQHRIQRIILVGHASIQENGRRLAGERIVWNLDKQTAKTHHALYQLTQQNNTVTTGLPAVYNAWGSATYAEHLPPKILNLRHASYTTCRPYQPTWRISAHHLHLNRTSGIGSATNVLLFAKQIPVFYFPYYRFPIDNRRHTGFLNPSYSHSKQNGTSFAWPFYWNIADNLDMTFYPKWFGKHGFTLGDNMRYLTQHTSGNIFATYVFNDNAFGQELTKLKQTSAASPYAPTLDARKQRWYVALNHQWTWQPHWTAQLHLARVSDDYYFQTYGQNVADINQNALPNNGDIRYHNLHWQWRGSFNTYQNLYPINGVQSNIQYGRLPELDGSANYPYFWKHAGFSADWQAVNFADITRYNPSPLTHGLRIHTRPGIALPFDFAGGNITPQFWLDATQYNVQPAINTPIERDANRVIPITDIHSTWYAESPWHIGSHHFLQTLEPELFYLYVPYQAQNRLPDFDATLNAFGTSNLISLNQFAGYDRVQNANQLSLGLTSRWLNATDGGERASLTLGLIDYFADRRVTTPDEQPDAATRQQSLSPLAATLSATLTPRTTLTTNAAWDLKPHVKLNNANGTLTYQASSQQLLSATYTYTPNGDYDNHHHPIAYQQVTLGGALPLGSHLQTLAYMNYNIGQHYPLGYFGGLGYNTCCWAWRVVVTRNYISILNNQRQYNTTYYIQILLKGLGNVGKSADSTITTGIPNYQDLFSPSH